MNRLLWILQVLLAVLFAFAGATKVFMFEKISQQLTSMKALSAGMWTAIGVFELICALGLILPAATGKMAILTPIAAAALAVESLLFVGFHAKYGEYSPMIFSVGFAALATFVAYGRFVLKPIR